jgi:hypothetical protein
MRLETFQFTQENGWSVKEFPKMDSKNTVLFLFGCPEMLSNTKAFEDLKKAYPLAQKMGCSSSGEIFGKHVYDHSLSVGITKFSKTETHVATCAIADSKDSFEVGKMLGHQLQRPDLRAVFILSDGLRVNGSELVLGINSILPRSTVVTGGLAGDGSRFKETWVINDGMPTTGYVTVLGLYGNHLAIEHGSQGGWDIFGPERVVTKSEGNVLYELDGKPALQIYKEYLGEKASELPASALLFPLQIRANSADTHRLVRTILAVDEKAQTMTFAGDIPKGSLAQLMRANFDRLIDGASNAAKVIPFGKNCRIS